MEEKRIKLGIYAELPKILEIVKGCAIEREIGMKKSGISTKLTHASCGPYTKARITEADVPKLNSAIWSLGRKLSTLTVEYSYDRNILIPRIKEAFSALFILKLAVQTLGITTAVAGKRMSLGASYANLPTFTEDEVVRLTFAARQIAMRLLSTEFYLDEG